MRLAGFPAHGNRLDWREAEGVVKRVPQLAVVPTVRQWDAGNRGQGTARPPLAAELTIASTVQRVALSGGRGCFQAGWQRALHHVPGGEGEGAAGGGKEEGGRRESEREEGMDGRKREGSRFAEAPKSAELLLGGSPVPSSQSRCERSKERHADVSPSMFEDVFVTVAFFFLLFFFFLFCFLLLLFHLRSSTITSSSSFCSSFS